MNATKRSLSLLPLFSALAPAALAGGGENGLTERMLFLPGGAQTTIGVDVTDLTADGRYAMLTADEALAPEDTNGLRDIYRLDLETGEAVLVSKTFGGVIANGPSYRGRVSEDGRFVAFQTLADNLVGLDSNGDYDVLRKDLVTGALVRHDVVSIRSCSQATPSRPSPARRRERRGLRRSGTSSQRSPGPDRCRLCPPRSPAVARLQVPDRQGRPPGKASRSGAEPAALGRSRPFDRARRERRIPAPTPTRDSSVRPRVAPARRADP